ncbi:helix-turn-helix domain-containing protein [Chitinophaga alhagiae]|uniref:helix-turn-helix domain-containing protein n=1 Tax=Chitinophaga alhagiae TaxID=2203219 RepID=UPI000E5BD1FD|nr:helix-turn-helix transcriptional regulator [Chitinophaga alhagiae]
MMKSNEDFLKELGERVKLARKKKGITIAELENLTGIRGTVISKIENGKKNIWITTLVRLAEGLEVKVGKLVG